MQGTFFKLPFQNLRTFPAIFSFLRVVWSWFFYWRNALGSENLSDTLNMFEQSTENFLDALEKKFQLKTWVLPENPNLVLNFIFSESTLFFHFSWHIFWLVCRAVTFFLNDAKCRLGGPFRYPEHVRKVHRKVCRDLWIQIDIQVQARSDITWYAK